MPGTLQAWQNMSIKGKVINQKSGIAVDGASVYINNSTFGTVCNSEGFFLLEHYPALPFDLIISAIGYETEVVKMTAENAGQPLNIPLKTKLLTIDEITITPPEKDGWEKYGKTFMDEFIGYSDFAAKCKLLNKEVLQFNFNQKTGILKVWADAPLQIRNNATGYDIIYWLEDFELNQFKHLLYFRGYAQFNTLKTGNAKQIRKFEENRILAYEGSVYHFMRSLYKGNPLEEGFEIRKLKRMFEKDAGAYLPKKTDTIFRKDTEKIKTLVMEMSTEPADAINFLINLKSWWDDSTRIGSLKIGKRDTHDTLIFRSYVFVKDTVYREKVYVNYYESGNEQQNTSAPEPAVLMTKRISLNGNIKIDNLPPVMKPQSLDILFLPLLKIDSLIRKEESGKVNLRFTDYLHVTFTKEKEDPEYLNRRAPSKKIAPDKQQSIISIKNKDGISITEDGNFYDSYDMITEQYWSYEKLDKLLPLDYIRP
jgi:hypothetical protein